MNSNNSQGKTTIEMMAYYEVYWSVKKYGLNIPHNLHGIFIPENLPETQKELYRTMWKNRKPTDQHCTGTHSGTSVNCSGKAESGKLICSQCQNALTHYYCGGKYIGQTRLPMEY
jgi:hypothetical protein